MRKLDALVHEWIFGRPIKWTEKSLLKADYDPNVDGIDLHFAIFWRAAMEVPDYSTDIVAAWRVVEKMITGTAYECYISHQTDGWVCFFTSPGDPEGLAQDAKVSKAISLAALRAVGVPETEIQEASDES